MIDYEEYGKKNNNEDEDDVKLPTTLIVIVIVLCSLVGVYIVSEALLGL